MVVHAQIRVLIMRLLQIQEYISKQNKHMGVTLVVSTGNDRISGHISQNYNSIKGLTVRVNLALSPLEGVVWEFHNLNHEDRPVHFSANQDVSEVLNQLRAYLLKHRGLDLYKQQLFISELYQEDRFI